jgi:hypothetical protein
LCSYKNHKRSGFVYDKKLLWRANLYIAEQSNDWNDIHPWNAPFSENEWNKRYSSLPEFSQENMPDPDAEDSGKQNMTPHFFTEPRTVHFQKKASQYWNRTLLSRPWAETEIP